MEISKLRKLSISNLILIILNDKYPDVVRRCAEVELRTRIKHLGWEYDDLLHFDDKVIQERGLDIENYLLSPQVSLQQLMETYFQYVYRKKYEENGLFFSEKHLCNENDLGSPFFTKICRREIARLDRSIGQGTYSDNLDKRIAKDVFEIRERTIKQDKEDLLRNNPPEFLCYNDALYQIDEEIILEPYMNLSPEEQYRYLKSPLGVLKLSIAELLNDTILDPDEIQYLYGLHFVRKDSRKLNYQKRLLMSQLNRGYEVDYSREPIQRVLRY